MVAVFPFRGTFLAEDIRDYMSSLNCCALEAVSLAGVSSNIKKIDNSSSSSSISRAAKRM